MTDQEKEHFYNKISSALFMELGAHLNVFLRQHYIIPEIEIPELHSSILNGILNLLGSTIIQISNGKEGREMLEISIISGLNAYLNKHERMQGMN